MRSNFCLIILLMTLISSCSIIRDRNFDYAAYPQKTSPAIKKSTLVDNYASDEFILPKDSLNFTENSRDYAKRAPIPASFQSYYNNVLFDPKTPSLVFLYKNIKEVKGFLKNNKDFKILAANNSTVNIIYNDRKYKLYIYKYTQNGNLFSDLSNFSNFFRSSYKEVRIAVFNMNNVIIKDNRAKNILNSIYISIANK